MNEWTSLVVQWIRICLPATEMQTQKADFWTQVAGGWGGWGEGKGKGNGESSLEAYTPPYVTQTANGNLLYGSGNSNQGSVTTQRGGEGWEVGGRFKTEGYMCMCVCVYTHIYTHTHIYICISMANSWQKLKQYCKAIILQLKKKKKESTCQCKGHRFHSWSGKIHMLQSN